MASGWKYKCSNCGKEWMIILGYGFIMGWKEQQKLEEEILKGKYGQEFKEEYSKDKDSFYLDTGNSFFLCEGCEKWFVKSSKTIYKLAEEEEGRAKSKTRDEQNYKLIYQRKRKCRACNKEMLELNEDAFNDLVPFDPEKVDKSNPTCISCPKCEKKNFPDPMILKCD